MQKVRMLKDYRVAINVNQTAVYRNGQEYSVDDENLKNMIHDGVAELVRQKPTPKENKVVVAAPENKKTPKKKR